MKPKLLVSCVAENDEKYHFRTLTLFKSIKQFGGRISEAQLVANFVYDVDPIIERDLKELGVRVRIVQPFDVQSRTSNKIRMLELEEDYDVLIGLDCDTVVVRDFYDNISTKFIQASPESLWPLDLQQWQFLFNSFGLPFPQDPNRTHFNSGV